MQQTESKISNTSQQHHEYSGHDIEICRECVSLMRATPKKCRVWSGESNSPICKGGFRN
jgi:hypothetical protein